MVMAITTMLMLRPMHMLMHALNRDNTLAAAAEGEEEE